VNEPINCRIWGNWDVNEGKKDEPLEQIVPYVHDSFVWTQDANPNSIRILNEYMILRSRDPEQPLERRKYFIALVKELQKHGTPISALGIQAHEPGEGRYWYSPSELLEAYNEMGELGYPLYTTEFLPPSSGRPILGDKKGVWDEATQAEYGELFYRMTFGHPANDCLIWFGLTAAVPPWHRSGCVLDEQYRPRQVYHTLKRLIHEEWKTHITGRLDEGSSYRFRGFHGKYEVSLRTANGKTHTYQLHLTKSGDICERLPVPASPLVAE
jgi:GH35 family endo-1,4-beta-xylanase